MTKTRLTALAIAALSTLGIAAVPAQAVEVDPCPTTSTVGVSSTKDQKEFLQNQSDSWKATEIISAIEDELGEAPLAVNSFTVDDHLGLASITAHAFVNLHGVISPITVHVSYPWAGDPVLHETRTISIDGISESLVVQA